MPDVLNQEEVDALLNMVSDGSVVEETPTIAPPQDGLQPDGASSGYNVVPSASIHVYDFKRPERVSKEQVVALEALHEVFARNISASLSGYLRTVIEVRLISVEQFTYSEFTMSLPSPTSVNLLSCPPLEGNMILEMNPSIIFPIIDRLLGGGNSEAYLLDRPFTNIELGLVNSLMSRILDQLNQTWENIHQIRFEIIETESNPFLMQIVAPNEPIVLLSFEVVMGEYSGMINLCVPFKVIEPIVPEFSKSNWIVNQGIHKSSGSRDHLLKNLAGAEIEVGAILTDMPLRLEDFLTLKPGDILDTGKSIRSDLLLSIEKERKFLGQAGLCKGRLAFRITERLTH